MSKHLQNEVAKLKKRILQLGARVEESVERAVRALLTRDAQLARQVISDDASIDAMEVDVEEDCLKILALHQPVAVDLRYIISVLKINNDLERIGDLASNAAERALTLSERALPTEAHALSEMASEVRTMLKKSLDAMINLDAAIAQEVLASDNVVDAANRKMFVRVLDAIRKRPDELNLLIEVMSVSRYLERIADHGTNIAEDVIYMMQGEIVRHHRGSWIAEAVEAATTPE
jgi:phosphate transport system protein